MGSFIVKEKTINKIISYIDHYHICPFSTDSVQTPWMKPLGKGMHQLNVSAFNVCYPNNRADSSVEYSFSCESPPSAVEAYKLLQCFLDQCHEGNIPKATLYQDLEHALTRIASTIITEMPEYQEAHWG